MESARTGTAQGDGVHERAVTCRRTTLPAITASILRDLSNTSVPR